MIVSEEKIKKCQEATNSWKDELKTLSDIAKQTENFLCEEIFEHANTVEEALDLVKHLNSDIRYKYNNLIGIGECVEKKVRERINKAFLKGCAERTPSE